MATNNQKSVWSFSYSAICVCRCIAGNISRVCVGKKCKTYFYYFFIADRYCYQCRRYEWLRIYELYRKRSAGEEYYFLEPRHFFRCKLDAGWYRWHCCCYHVYHFFSLFKAIECIASRRRRSQLSRC